MKAFIIGTLLFFLLLLTIFHNSFASTYTFTWCPVKGKNNTLVSYSICVGDINNNNCIGTIYYTTFTTYKINIPDNIIINIQVKATNIYWDWNTYQLISIESQFSNPVIINSGITPPIINCGC